MISLDTRMQEIWYVVIIDFNYKPICCTFKGFLNNNIVHKPWEKQDYQNLIFEYLLHLLGLLYTPSPGSPPPYYSNNLIIIHAVARRNYNKSECHMPTLQKSNNNNNIDRQQTNNRNNMKSALHNNNNYSRSNKQQQMKEEEETTILYVVEWLNEPVANQTNNE